MNKNNACFFVASHLRENVDRKQFFCMKMYLGKRFYMPLRLKMMHSIHKLGYKKLPSVPADLKNVNNLQMLL